MRCVHFNSGCRGRLLIEKHKDCEKYKESGLQTCTEQRGKKNVTVKLQETLATYVHLHQNYQDYIAMESFFRGRAS